MGNGIAIWEGNLLFSIDEFHQAIKLAKQYNANVCMMVTKTPNGFEPVEVDLEWWLLPISDSAPSNVWYPTGVFWFKDRTTLFSAGNACPIDICRKVGLVRAFPASVCIDPKLVDDSSCPKTGVKVS
jgi:hypothetical protein